ncbi:DUF3775 domain-containing protein [Geobacter sp. FeAm09]|nr:DUF3775 domain-containing protein [Geobacter sp. FeAm09]
MSYEQSMDIVAIMYSGRGDGTFSEMREYVDNFSHEQCMNVIHGKFGRLAEYLKRGLARLNTSGS